MEDEGEHIPLNNSIEQMLKPEQNNAIDPQAILYMELVEVLKQKVEVVQSFLSDEGMKTEITIEQRRLLPLMQNLALDPYPSVLEFNRKKFITLAKQKPDVYTDDYIKSEMERIRCELKKPILLDFINEFLRYGIAVKRKGRLEDQKAISSMMSEAIDIINKSGGNQGKKGMF